MMLGGSYNPDENSGTTAVEPVVRTIDREGTTRYVDLSGRLLQVKPEKGLYILNGKKHFNK